jgi:hypothetical protein
MTIRCPKCRKRYDEPHPKRCGCGQSLLAVLAAERRPADAPQPVTAKTPTTRAENDW